MNFLAKLQSLAPPLNLRKPPFWDSPPEILTLSATSKNSENALQNHIFIHITIQKYQNVLYPNVVNPS